MCLFVRVAHTRLLQSCAMGDVVVVVVASLVYLPAVARWLGGMQSSFGRKQVSRRRLSFFISFSFMAYSFIALVTGVFVIFVVVL